MRSAAILRSLDIARALLVPAVAASFAAVALVGCDQDVASSSDLRDTHMGEIKAYAAPPPPSAPAPAAPAAAAPAAPAAAAASAAAPAAPPPAVAPAAAPSAAAASASARTAAPAPAASH
ncbi:MAG TPA: hypothetical protein VHV30_00360 [Polyangiaceae bacterium]|jgi:hypothetical protein|nr:hypothetical protein [Polyangiaceae bacterium]